MNAFPRCLLVAPALLCLLASCQPEAHAYLGTDADGQPEILVYPLSVVELLPLVLACLIALGLLLQAFIPWQRRLSVRVLSAAMRRVGIERQRDACARMLAACAAWFAFFCGLCFLPLIPALYQDTFYPVFSGPMNMGFTPPALGFALLGIAYAFPIAALWATIRWCLLRRRK